MKFCVIAPFQLLLLSTSSRSVVGATRRQHRTNNNNIEERRSLKTKGKGNECILPYGGTLVSPGDEIFACVTNCGSEIVFIEDGDDCDGVVLSWKKEGGGGGVPGPPGPQGATGATGPGGTTGSTGPMGRTGTYLSRHVGDNVVALLCLHRASLTLLRICLMEHRCNWSEWISGSGWNYRSNW